MPAAGCPEWTEYRKKNGLESLGMQNTSVALYQRLSPGISNVTPGEAYFFFAKSSSMVRRATNASAYVGPILTMERRFVRMSAKSSALRT
jgi:hypothetical protein